MIVKKWMTRNPATVKPKDSITDAVSLMKERDIRHLPVVENGRLVGIISNLDLKEFSPSKATSLDVYEVHYLLSKAAVADAMRRDPLRVQPDDTIEKAALLMHDNKIGCLPVVDGSGKVVGVLTKEDVFEALVQATGCRSDSVRLQLTISDEPGSIKVVTDKARARGLFLRSIFTTYGDVPPGKRELILRVSGETLALEKELRADYPDLVVHRGC
jgi:acetoin utilization protein AcuB